MSDPSTAHRIEDLCDEIVALLRKYGHEYHASYVAEMRAFWPDNRSAFAIRSYGGDMWGAPGSVLDVTFVDPNRPDAEVSADNRAYLIALGRLGESMHRERIGSSYSDSVAASVARMYPEAGISPPHVEGPNQGTDHAPGQDEPRTWISRVLKRFRSG